MVAILWNYDVSVHQMDVIRCPVSAGQNVRGTKLSRMAVELRKLRKFSPAINMAGGVKRNASE